MMDTEEKKRIKILNENQECLQFFPRGWFLNSGYKIILTIKRDKDIFWIVKNIINERLSLNYKINTLYFSERIKAVQYLKIIKFTFENVKIRYNVLLEIPKLKLTAKDKKYFILNKDEKFNIIYNVNNDITKYNKFACWFFIDDIKI